jgi:heme/copper-type cytochrome/quinol oxidase subunit 2
MFNKFAFAALASAASGLAHAATPAVYTPTSRFNLQTPVTEIARQIYSLHDMMMIICALIFVAVFSVMFYSIWKHRKSKGAVAANFHESTTVEIVWTVIPFIIVIIMALPATRTVVAMKDTSNSTTSAARARASPSCRSSPRPAARSKAPTPRAPPTCWTSPSRWSSRSTRKSASSPLPTT